MATDMPRALTPEQLASSWRMKQDWDDAVSRLDKVALRAVQDRIRTEFPWSRRAEADLDAVLARAQGRRPS